MTKYPVTLVSVGVGICVVLVFGVGVCLVLVVALLIACIVHTIARAGRGAYETVTSSESQSDIKSKMDTIVTKITQNVLTDIKIDWRIQTKKRVK